MDRSGLSVGLRPHTSRAACRRVTPAGLALAALLLGAATDGRAAELMVNSASVLGDRAPGDGFCETVVYVDLGSGPVPECTLRAAVEEANALPGPDAILFHPAIPKNDGDAIRTPVSWPLVVSDRVTIDGTTATGFDLADPDGVPAVFHLDGSSADDGHGLVVSWSADGTVIRGLSIHGFPGAGISVQADDATVQGCAVGLRPDGSPHANGSGIALDGTYGLEIVDNVVSGNTGYGVTSSAVDGDSSLLLEGNVIGLSGDGEAPLPNGSGGVFVSSTDGGWDIVGNVIAGNGGPGVVVHGNGSQLRGNRIGVNPAGVPFANAGAGIRIDGPQPFDGWSNEIGGSEPGHGNIIGGNDGPGIEMLGYAELNAVRGNWIGTDAQGADLGNAGHGIALGTNHVVGGAELGSGNVIGHNASDGIHIVGDSNEILGNWVGTDAEGNDLGNADDGIELVGQLLTLASSRYNVLGSSATAAADELDSRGNTIAFNGDRGVELGPDLYSPPFGGVRNNAIRGNHVHSNGGAGIDLHPFGPTANDPGDGDTGTNLLQNHPVIQEAVYRRGPRTLRVSYSVDASPLQAAFPLAVDFYLADASGSGARYLGSDVYTQSDAPGPREAELTIPDGVAIDPGTIVATATDTGGNTSEFGAATGVTKPPPTHCGLGTEIALLLPLLGWCRAWRRASRRLERRPEPS